MSTNSTTAAEVAEHFFNIVRKIILFFTFISGAAIFVMIGVTITDIVLRFFKSGVTGAYDIVCLAGAVSVVCALPYVTAVKGHIAIEFFYQKAGRWGRILLDTVFRLILLVLFIS